MFKNIIWIYNGKQDFFIGFLNNQSVLTNTEQKEWRQSVPFVW